LVAFKDAVDARGRGGTRGKRDNLRENRSREGLHRLVHDKKSESRLPEDLAMELSMAIHPEL